MLDTEVWACANDLHRLYSNADSLGFELATSNPKSNSTTTMPLSHRVNNKRGDTENAWPVPCLYSHSLSIGVLKASAHGGWLPTTTITSRDLESTLACSVIGNLCIALFLIHLFFELCNPRFQTSLLFQQRCPATHRHHNQLLQYLSWPTTKQRNAYTLIIISFYSFNYFTF